MKEPVYIAGISMTNFGVCPDKSIKDLTREAVTEALADANAAIGDIGAAFFGNVGQGLFEGQITIPGQVALRSMGFERIPIYNVENACATGTTAVNLAVNALRAGVTDVALAVGAEKMNIDDMSKVMASFEGGFDVHDKEAVYQLLEELGGAADGGSGHRTAFMEIYAAMARAHMKAFGTTQEQMAMVASKNHFHSTMNPKAHFRVEMSVEDILAARPIGYPLTVPMCSPMTDGAAAAVLCTKEGLERIKATRPVKVLASVIGTGSDRKFEQWDQSTSRLAALRAYEEAGVAPEDISIAEVHDAAAFGEIVQSEYLGFCELGGGGALAESGATRLGGRIPINTSGGLESKGHPIGASGIAQLYELCCQLRGEAGERQVEGARLAISENGGGMYGCEEAVAAVTILGK